MPRSVLVRFVSLVLVLVLLPFAGSLPLVSPAVARADDTGPTEAQEAAPEAPSEPDSPQDVGWSNEAQAAIAVAEYAVTWQEGLAVPDAGAAYQAPNRGQDFRAYFLPGGIRIVPRAWSGEGAPVWQLSLALSNETEVAPAPDGNQVAYQRPEGVTESYRNEPSGLTQRFEIAAGTAEAATLTLSVNTNLIPILAEDGPSIDFVDAQGAAVLRYADMRAIDAAGLDLPITLALASSEAEPAVLELRIAITATGAAYPLEVTAMLASPAAPDVVDGVGSNPAWTAERDQAYASFGRSVATAGDVNGDGYSDVVIGAPNYDNGQSNEGRVYVYHGSATGLGASPAWTAESNQANAIFGQAVATAGDVNGDGYSDVIVGAPLYANGEALEGRAYVYHGGPNGLSPTPAWSVESNLADTWFGWSVATAGDVNGDGYSDVIVGAPNYDNGETDEGRVLVYHGGPGGLAGSPAWTIERNGASALLGRSVATAGDVDGDGYADVIVGAPGDKFGQVNEGRAYVYRGGAGGVGGNPILTAESNQAEARLGTSVATAGDVNGDGLADVIVGAPEYDNGQTDEGRAFLYLGRVGSMSANPAWTAEGDQAGARFGESVATGGDVNGDGYADVIVGAYNFDNGQTDEGRAYVYLGGSAGLRAGATWTGEGDQAGAGFGRSVATAGDVNGDGFSDVVAGAYNYDHGQEDEGRAFVYQGAASLGSDYAWRAVTDQKNASFGRHVATAGDVNRDGYADVIIGAYEYDNGHPGEGRVYVYHGGPAGLGASPAWTAESNQSGAWFGWSVATAGDVNGDGYSDIIIGACGFDNGQTDEGRAFVYYGGPGGLRASPAWTAEGNQAGACFGESVATAGDVNRDGYADVIIGASGYDNGQTDEGRAFVYYGARGGLGSSPAWTAESNQADAAFGKSVATAGDVNRDSYADVIVVAPGFDNGETDEGRVYVYHGSAGGISANPVWTTETNVASRGLAIWEAATAGDVNGDRYSDVIVGFPGFAFGAGRAYVFHGGPGGLTATPAWTATGGRYQNEGFGFSVGTAGDVNRDGYADVIVGSYATDQYSTGRAYLYHGSPGGLDSTPNWHVDNKILPNTGGFGMSVRTAGDVNGDGYADVIVGAPFYIRDSAAYVPTVFVYHGNGGGVDMQPQQRRADDTAPIPPGGTSDRTDAFRLTLLGRTPYGRGRIKLEWEVKRSSEPFNGQGIGSMPNWVNPGAAGVAFNQVISGLSPNTAYHWRMRVRYHPATTPFQQYGRWITPPWRGRTEIDLRTAPDAYRGLLLPLILR